MSFIYSKPKCNKGTKLIKTRCECKTQKKALKIKKKSIRKTLKKKSKTKKKVKIKKIKIILKKQKKKVKKITVKKKRYRCPNGTRRNSKTGLCELIKVKSVRKNNRSTRIHQKHFSPTSPSYSPNTKKKTLIIKSIEPSAKDMIAKSLSKLKSFSPSVNKKLKSLQTYTPELGLFGCKQQEISFNVKGKRECVKWSSKKAKSQMMSNLTNSSIGKNCNNIIAPKQSQSNCWFNCLFMVFFISSKGKKFTRYLRQVMITGKRLDGSNINKKLQWPFFLLNKCIEAVLIGDSHETAWNYAYLMDTNDIIREIYRNLPKKLQKKKIGMAVQTAVAWNPLTYYKGMVRYLDSPLKSHKKQLSLDSIILDEPITNKKDFENYINQSQEASSFPDIIVVDIAEEVSKKTVKPIKISLKNKTGEKVNYVLDSVVLRDIKGNHFTAYITCNGKEYGFDGESHARMQPFKWKKKLQKNSQWRFADQYQTFFNFTKGYQELFYYRV